MPYDRGLAERLDAIVGGRRGFQRKTMFGGIGWMLNGNMCVGARPAIARHDGHAACTHPGGSSPGSRPREM
jgi:hypothetical protein